MGNDGYPSEYHRTGIIINTIIIILAIAFIVAMVTFLIKGMQGAEKEIVRFGDLCQKDGFVFYHTPMQTECYEIKQGEIINYYNYKIINNTMYLRKRVQ